MKLKTERLCLRAVEKSDNELLMNMINDPDMEFLLGGWSFPVSSRDQEEWFLALSNNRDILRYMIDDIDSGNTIGTIILTGIDYKNGVAEIHIKIASGANRGKGFGKEAISAIVEYAFNELRLNCIFATISSYNEASCKAFEKCGFKREGVLRSRLFKRNQYVDVYSYSLLKSEFEG